MRFPRWIGAAFSLELRQVMAYRADFWLEFVGNLGLQVGLAWFLWRAVLEARGTDTVGGLGLAALTLYYLALPLVEKVTRGHEMGFLSADIYEGTLNRYLVYPVGVFLYKYLRHAAVAAAALVQMALVIAVVQIFWGFPEPFRFHAVGLLQGLVAMGLASVLYFLMASCLEMVAFWADNVWSLLVMQRFAIRFLGGGMVPLALFPDSLESVLRWLPFGYLLGFPVEALLGTVGPGEFLRACLVCVAWIGVFALLARWIWSRGELRYAGVGI